MVLIGKRGLEESGDPILEVQYPYRSSLTNNDIGKVRLKITQKTEKTEKRTTSHVLQSTMKRSFDNNYRCT